MVTSEIGLTPTKTSTYVIAWRDSCSGTHGSFQIQHGVVLSSSCVDTHPLPTRKFRIGSMSNFDPNAILRGAQLTVVGGKSSPANSRVQASVC